MGALDKKEKQPELTASNAAEALVNLSEKSDEKVKTSGKLSSHAKEIESKLEASALKEKMKKVGVLSDKLAVLFNKKIVEHAGMSMDKLKALAQTDPKKFAEMAPGIMRKVRTDPAIQANIDACEELNPGMGGMVSNYFEGVGDYWENKSAEIKKQISTFIEERVRDSSNIKKEDFSTFDLHNALSVGTVTAFWSVIYEGDVKTSLKTFGLAAAVGSNEGAAQVVLKTVNAAVLGLGHGAAIGLDLVTDGAHSVASGNFFGLNEKQRQEALKTFEDIEKGVKYFPMRIRGVWQKMRIEQKGETVKEGQEITDTDIKAAALFAVQSLDERMSPIEIAKLHLDVYNGKLDEATFRRYLLTTSAGGLATFFMGHSEHGEVFNKYVKNFMEKEKAGGINKFTEKDLVQMDMFGFAELPDIEKKGKLRGIAGDFNLGASGMILKYLMIFGVLAASSVWGIKKFTDRWKGKDPEAAPKNKATKGADKLAKALKGDYSKANWSDAMIALGAMGLLKTTSFFSNGGEIKTLRTLKDDNAKRAIFKALQDEKTNWVVSTSLKGVREKQKMLWDIIKTGGGKDIYEKRIGIIGDLGDGLTKDSPSKKLKKDDRWNAYQNLKDLRDIYKKIDEKGGIAFSDFKSGMTLWEIAKNPVKFTWKESKNVTTLVREKMGNVSRRLEAKGKFASMKKVWKGKHGLMLGNMEILGVPKPMLDNLKNLPKDQQGSAILNLAIETESMYK